MCVCGLTPVQASPLGCMGTGEGFRVLLVRGLKVELLVTHLPSSGPDEDDASDASDETASSSEDSEEAG